MIANNFVTGLFKIGELLRVPLRACFGNEHQPLCTERGQCGANRTRRADGGPVRRFADFAHHVVVCLHTAGHRRAGALEDDHIASGIHQQRDRVENLRQQIRQRLPIPVRHPQPGEMRHHAGRRIVLHLRFDHAIGRRNNEPNPRPRRDGRVIHCERLLLGGFRRQNPGKNSASPLRGGTRISPSEIRGWGGQGGNR